jgi:hypothetical protein
MHAEPENFLTQQLREAVANQPELEQLNALVLSFGGEFLVAPRKPDNDITTLLAQGFSTFGPIKLHVMDRSSCHQNIAALWRNREHGIVAIATGYALSEDGLWRQHSWGILRDGLLETTKQRSRYFGIVLQGEAADDFAAANPPDEC